MPRTCLQNKKDFTFVPYYFSTTRPTNLLTHLLFLFHEQKQASAAVDPIMAEMPAWLCSGEDVWGSEKTNFIDPVPSLR